MVVHDDACIASRASKQDRNDIFRAVRLAGCKHQQRPSFSSLATPIASRRSPDTGPSEDPLNHHACRRQPGPPFAAPLPQESTSAPLHSLRSPFRHKRYSKKGASKAVFSVHSASCLCLASSLACMCIRLFRAHHTGTEEFDRWIQAGNCTKTSRMRRESFPGHVLWRARRTRSRTRRSSPHLCRKKLAEKGVQLS